MVEDSTTEIEENTPEEGELVMPTTAAIGDIGMWVHAKENILKNGRTQH
jgi:translation initiation factor 2 alpha subunit (eIF-2alpha)